MTTSTYAPHEAFTPDADDLDCVVYGVPVAFIGEDGELLMLGHVEPRKAIAAVMAHGRREAGLDPDEVLGYGIEDDRVAEALGNVTHTWAVFNRHAPYCDDAQTLTREQLVEDGLTAPLGDDEPMREVCVCYEEFGWWATWLKGGDVNPAAVAVTRYAP